MNELMTGESWLMNAVPLLGGLLHNPLNRHAIEKFVHR